MCLAWHHLTGSYKGQCYISWKYVPTVISGRDSDLIGVRITQTQDAWEEKVQHNLMRWHCEILRNDLWKWALKREFISKPRRGWGGGWWIQQHFVKISKKMAFHSHVNKEITFVRPNDIMRYARGKHTQLNIGWNVHPKYGLGSTINVRMMIH